MAIPQIRGFNFKGTSPSAYGPVTGPVNPPNLMDYKGTAPSAYGPVNTPFNLMGYKGTAPTAYGPIANPPVFTGYKGTTPTAYGPVNTPNLPLNLMGYKGTAPSAYGPVMGPPLNETLMDYAPPMMEYENQLPPPTLSNPYGVQSITPQPIEAPKFGAPPITPAGPIPTIRGWGLDLF